MKLQAGFSRCSGYPVNPYQTTSADLTFPSGDAFSVYPGKNGPVLSLRSLVFYEGVQDMQVCKLLESFIGKDEVASSNLASSSKNKVVPIGTALFL